jgi:hypothetical protein
MVPGMFDISSLEETGSLQFIKKGKGMIFKKNYQGCPK